MNTNELIDIDLSNSDMNIYKKEKTMKYLLIIAAMLTSLYATDFSQMSTENMMNMRGNVPVDQRDDFRKEMQKRMQSMTQDERQKYSKMGHGMQGQGMMNMQGMGQGNGMMMNNQGMNCGQKMMNNGCMHCCCCCCQNMMMNNQGMNCSKGMKQGQGIMNMQGMGQGQGMMNQKGMQQGKGMMMNDQ